MKELYNRYIPQGDGTYSRRRISEPAAPQSIPQPAPPPICANPSPQRPERPAAPAGSFLRQLLPRDFSTEDLIVVLLLLLIAGDNPENQSSALLTLALYLFL